MRGASSTSSTRSAATTGAAPAAVPSSAATRVTGNGRQRRRKHERKGNGYRPYRHFLNPSILAVAERYVSCTVRSAKMTPCGGTCVDDSGRAWFWSVRLK